MATASPKSSYDRFKEVKEFDDSKIGVKGLSDSGITTIPRFFIHPPEIRSNSNKPKSSFSIPIIDLSNKDFPARRRAIINQVCEAARTWGFFQVINPGVPTSLLEETIGAIEAFHNQPLEVKSKYHKRDERSGVRYTSNDDLYRATAACWHDSLSAWMGPTPLDEDELPENCRKEVIAWDSSATKVAETVMEMLSEGLGLEADKFKELSFSGTRAIVGHCYPYCPQPDLTLGITSHTDPGILTVLLQNQVPGLQVRYQDEWVDVNPVSGGLIINVGDFLQIVSNGEYTSVQHRVLANGNKNPRISIVEFFNLSKWKEDGHYGPLLELLSVEKPAIYRNFTEQEFLENFYGKGLDSKSFTEKLKIQG